MADQESLDDDKWFPREEDIGRRIYEPTFATSQDGNAHLAIRPVSARTYQQLSVTGEELNVYGNDLFVSDSRPVSREGEGGTFYEKRRSARLRSSYARPSIHNSDPASRTILSEETHSLPNDLNLAPPERQSSRAGPTVEVTAEMSRRPPSIARLLSAATIPERMELLMTHGQQHQSLSCYIIRDRSKLSASKVYPCYRMYLDDSHVFLMSARLRKRSKTHHYLISLSESDLSRMSPCYFGKVRSNFFGTQFTIYDNGGKAETSDRSCRQKLRIELATVRYEHSFLGTRGPRRMTVTLPPTQHPTKQSPDSVHADVSISSVDSQTEQASRPTVLINKTPKWNDKLNAYCLNFKGRVTQASVKNFQLVSGDSSEDVVLQFGKVGNERFNVDYGWPVSALQAFGICLSSFDSKLVCE